MDRSQLLSLAENPILITPDLFTPLTRTPWAGEEIGKRYKSEVVPDAKGKRIGESWEFSCDPDFPSRVMGAELSIPELVEAIPQEIISPRLAAQGASSCEILIKLLNASEPLSLQVHPNDSDPSLGAGECGKPESWLVLHAEKGAGIYLGFNQAIEKDRLREILLNGDECKKYLQFVEVKAGDYFELEAGVPHAIGAGVTLLEPQRILFGKSGKTYRLWDWGRRYNNLGILDVEGGSPRELHLEEGLRLIDSMNQVGSSYVNTIRRSGVSEELSDGIDSIVYPSNDNYQVIQIRSIKGKSLRVEIEQGYGVVVPFTGGFTAIGKGEKKVTAMSGQSVLFPHKSLPTEFKFIEDTSLALVVPSGSHIFFNK